MLKETLTNDMKDAMRKKEKEKLATIRMILSAVKNAEIQEKKELKKDEDIHPLIQKEIKQTKDSQDAYKSQPGYDDKVEELQRRIDTLMGYLPKQLTEAELKEIIETLMSELNIQGKQEKGKLMGALMPKVKGKAEGALVNKLVTEALN